MPTFKNITVDGRKVRLFTSNMTDQPAVLCRDIAKLVGLSHTTIVRGYQQQTGGHLERSVENVKSGKRRSHVCVLTLAAARTILERYLDTDITVYKRELVTLVLIDLVDQLEAVQPLKSRVRTAGKANDERHKTTTIVPDLIPALRREVTGAVATALESIGRSRLDPKDIDALRRAVRDEVKAALKEHKNGQGSAAIEIASELNAGASLPLTRGTADAIVDQLPPAKQVELLHCLARRAAEGKLPG